MHRTRIEYWTEEAGHTYLVLEMDDDPTDVWNEALGLVPDHAAIIDGDVDNRPRR